MSAEAAAISRSRCRASIRAARSFREAGNPGAAAWKLAEASIQRLAARFSAALPNELAAVRLVLAWRRESCAGRSGGYGMMEAASRLRELGITGHPTDMKLASIRRDLARAQSLPLAA